jgi:hypothetical protein
MSVYYRQRTRIPIDRAVYDNLRRGPQNMGIRLIEIDLDKVILRNAAEHGPPSRDTDLPPYPQAHVAGVRAYQPSQKKVSADITEHGKRRFFKHAKSSIFGDLREFILICRYYARHFGYDAFPSIVSPNSASLAFVGLPN